MNQKIRIKLKSFDHNLVDKSAEKIVKTVKSTGAVVSGPVPLPTRKQIFTVNRSTFVNKKAREQFQLCTFKRILDIYSSTPKTIDALMKLELPSGVEVEAVQIAYDEKSEKHTSSSLLGHFKKAGTTPKRKMAEFKGMPEVNLGDTLTVDLFSEEDWVDVTGISKGKGFQGVVKRHGFGGVGGQTHGQHNRQRKPGSLGASSYPSRVFKGKRLPGQMGGEQVKVLNLRVLKVIPESNLILVKGSIPGAKGAYLTIEK